MDAHVQHAKACAETDGLSRLGWCFERLHSLAAAQVFNHMGKAMRSGDVSFSQVNALFRLYAHGPQRIADLARALGLSPCATSRLVTRLADEGLVEKRQNAENRREKHIVLTAAGQKFLKNLERNTADAYRNILADLPPESSGRLLELLETLLPQLPSPERMLHALSRR